MDTNDLLSSRKYYDSIAGEYALIRSQRRLYLDKVDSIIINDFHQKSKRILDVGAGDGSRGIKIFKNIEADTMCLVEESNEMIKNSENIRGVTIFAGSIQQFRSQQNFDLILCLWNVLGHINTFQDRVDVLKLLKGILSVNGTIVIDFNNRYNYKQYGVLSVLRNMALTFFIKEPGWFDLKSKDGTTHSKVYIHSYFEIMKIISQAGLRVESLKIIDYSSGIIQNNLFQGQYLFYLKNDTSHNGS